VLLSGERVGVREHTLVGSSQDLRSASEGLAQQLDVLGAFSAANGSDSELGLRTAGAQALASQASAFTRQYLAQPDPELERV